MKPEGVDRQPVSAVQWVDPATLTANSWNPNHVSPPEMRLLKISILEDGWTMPVVVGKDHEIIDGFHRYTLGLSDPDVRALTGGLIPIVVLDLTPEHRRMSTIRHNRARGSHYVRRMADLVHWLVDSGVPDDEIAFRLQMDPEEVARLRDRGSMIKRHTTTEEGDQYSVAWEPAEDKDGTKAESPWLWRMERGKGARRPEPVPQPTFEEDPTT